VGFFVVVVDVALFCFFETRSHYLALELVILHDPTVWWCTSVIPAFRRLSLKQKQRQKQKIPNLMAK
jgi:hypothetical protein